MQNALKNALFDYFHLPKATESSLVLGYWGMQTSLREGYYLFYLTS
jgi:hypothetical protein